MKPRLVLVLILWSCLNLRAQNSVVWTDSLTVASTSLAITAPIVQLLPDGTPLVFWGTSGSTANTQIWCSRLENGVFTSPVGVVKSPYTPGLYGFGGYDVALAGNRVYVVYEQLQQGILLARSDDGGLNFDSSVVVQGPVPGGFATLASVEADENGHPVVSYILDGNGASHAVRRSTNGGQSFGEAQTANAPAPGGAVCECCTADLLCSGDSTWLVFRNNNQNIRDIWVSRSNSPSAPFDIAVDADATNWQLNNCPIAGPRMVRQGDSLLTVWVSGAGGFGRVFLSTLHAGTMQKGQEFGFVSGSGTQVAQSQPCIAANGDTVGVAFLEKGKEIAFVYAENGASGLNNPYVLFALPGHILKYPSLVFRNGTFYLTYVDVSADRVIYRKGVVSPASNVQQPAAKAAVSIFPHPVFQGEFTVRSAEDPIDAVFLYDLQGKLLLQKQVAAQEVQLRTDGLPPGIYVLQVKTESSVVLKKVVKGTQF